MAEPAPLYATAAAPIPEGGEAEWFTGSGGARLRAALFPTRQAPRGAVLLSPGRTEPIEKYFETIEVLAGRGYVVLVHDWRGQGLSQRMLTDRMLGHARGYKDFLTDYAALIAAFQSRMPKPWIALGHSMGGCLTLLALASGQTGFSGAILSAPMLGLNTGTIPAPVARIFASALSVLGLGGRPIMRSPPSTDFESNILTHDRTRWERNEGQTTAFPELALGDPTWGWLDFAFTATGILQTGPQVPKLAIPVTVITAGQERLVDNVASRLVASRLPRGRILDVPGAYHEILQETDEVRAVFWREFDDLVEKSATAPTV